MSDTEKSYAELNRKEKNAMAKQTKIGSKADGTEGAHIVSHENAKAILGSKPGPKITDNRVNDTVEVLQSDDNIRIKSKNGNQSTDSKVDKKLIEKWSNDEPLTTNSEINRAVQQVKVLQENSGVSSDLDYVRIQIENMQIRNGVVGHPTSVKNAALPEHPNIDLRSSAVRNESIKFKNDGTVDMRSAAVKSGDVFVTKAGDVDLRCSAVKQGNLMPLSSQTNSSSSSYNSSSTTGSGSSGTTYTGSRGGTYTITS